MRDNAFDVLGPSHHTLDSLEAPDGIQQFAFTPDSRRARLVVGGPGGGAHETGNFLALGIHHILSGWDHLLFLVGLLLPRRRPPLADEDHHRVHHRPQRHPLARGPAGRGAVGLSLLFLLRRTRWERRAVPSSSLAILVLGLVLFVERGVR